MPTAEPTARLARRGKHSRSVTHCLGGSVLLSSSLARECLRTALCVHMVGFSSFPVYLSKPVKQPDPCSQPCSHAYTSVHLRAYVPCDTVLCSCCYGAGHCILRTCPLLMLYDTEPTASPRAVAPPLAAFRLWTCAAGVPGAGALRPPEGHGGLKKGGMRVVLDQGMCIWNEVHALGTTPLCLAQSVGFASVVCSWRARARRLLHACADFQWSKRIYTSAAAVHAEVHRWLLSSRAPGAG